MATQEGQYSPGKGILNVDGTYSPTKTGDIGYAPINLTPTPEQNQAAMGYVPPKPDTLGNYRDASGKSVADPNAVPDPTHAFGYQAPASSADTTTPTLAGEYATYNTTLDKGHQDYLDTKARIDAGLMTPAEQQIWDTTKATYDAVRAEQLKGNQAYQGGIAGLNARNGLAQNATDLALGNVQAAVEEGNAKILKINNESSAALGKLQQDFKNNDLKSAIDSWNEVQDWAGKKHTAFTEMQKATTDAAKAVSDAKIAADKVKYEEVTKPIQDLEKEALANGASADVIAKIKSSKSVDEALAAAGDSIQKMTGDFADYPQYRKDAIAKGLTPLGATDWLAKEKTDAAKLKTQEAYSNAYAGAKGKAQAEADFASVNGPAIPQDYQSVLGGRTPEQTKNFNSLSAGDKSVVAQLISGNALLSDLVKSRGAAGTKDIQRYIQEATSVDPTFSVNTNKIRYGFLQKWNDPNGKSSTMKNSINTSLGHLADFKTNADALDSGSLKFMNNVKNILSTETGNAGVLKVRTDIGALASEIATIYKNGVSPSETEIEDWRKVLAADFSKGQFQGVADEISKLLSSKITATRYQYKSTMGSELSTTLIDPEKKQALIDAGISPESIVKENVPQTPETVSADAQSNVETFVSSPEAKNPLDTKLNGQIYNLTGKTFKTAGELSVYMSGLPGATPDSVLAVLKNLGLIK